MDWERHEYYEDPWGGNEDLHRDGCLPMLIWGIVAAIVCALIGGCKTQYIPIETVKTEIHHTRDSVHHTDSIIKEKNTTIMQLDSAAMAKYGIKLEKAEKAWLVMQKELENKIKMLSEHKTDTFIKVDSVAVPYPIVTNKVRFIDKLGYVGLGVIIAFTLTCVLLIVIWLISRLLRAQSLV